jgi:hypothetical protein
MRDFTVTGTLKLKPVWTELNGVTDITDRIVVNDAIGLNSSDPAAYADAIWKDGFDLTETGLTLNLKSLSQKIFGGSGLLGFNSVKIIYAENRSSDNPVEVFGSVSGRWPGASESAVRVGPGGVYYATFPAGETVSAGASNFFVKSVGGPAEFAIAFIGVLDESV